MAKTKKYKKGSKKYGRKGFGKSTLKQGRLTVRGSPSTQHVFPPRLRTMLTVTDNGYQVAGATSGTILVKLNSVFQPFNTGSPLPVALVAVGGLYPNGYKNLIGTSGGGAGIYNYFRVYAAKIEVMYQPQALGDNLIAALGCYNSTKDTAFNSVVTLGQSQFAKTKTITCNQNKSNMMSLYMDCATMFGVNRQAIGSNANYWGVLAADPAENLLFQTRWETLDQAVLAVNLGIQIKVHYYVEFFDILNSVILD